MSLTDSQWVKILEVVNGKLARKHADIVRALDATLRTIRTSRRNPHAHDAEYLRGLHVQALAAQVDAIFATYPSVIVEFGADSPSSLLIQRVREHVESIITELLEKHSKRLFDYFAISDQGGREGTVELSTAAEDAILQSGNAQLHSMLEPYEPASPAAAHPIGSPSITPRYVKSLDDMIEHIREKDLDDVGRPIVFPIPPQSFFWSRHADLKVPLIVALIGSLVTSTGFLIKVTYFDPKAERERIALQDRSAERARLYQERKALGTNLIGRLDMCEYAFATLREDMRKAQGFAQREAARRRFLPHCTVWSDSTGQFKVQIANAFDSSTAARFDDLVKTIADDYYHTAQLPATVPITERLGVAQQTINKTDRLRKMLSRFSPP